MRANVCERCGTVYDPEVAESLGKKCPKGGKLISVQVERMPKDVVTFDNRGTLFSENETMP